MATARILGPTEDRKFVLEMNQDEVDILTSILGQFSGRNNVETMFDALMHARTSLTDINYSKYQTVSLLSRAPLPVMDLTKR